MRSLITLVLASAMLPVATARAAVVLDFDDRPGWSSFTVGAPVPPEYFITNQYRVLGVLFDSPGGGLALLAAGNAPSPPNSVTSTAPGPLLSRQNQITAEFFLSSRPGVVDLVRFTTTDSTTGTTTLTALDYDGLVLGSASAEGFATISITRPGLIHSVLITGTNYAIDNFVYDGLGIPAPSAAAPCTLAVLLLLRRRRALPPRPQRA